MFTLRELDNRLALKLGDPVTNNGAGELFDLEQRVNYLSRAYGRIIRTLKHLMGSYSPQFADTLSYKVVNLTSQPDKGWFSVDFNTMKVYLDKVTESYLIIENDKEVIKAPIINIPNIKWLSTINGENDLQKPDATKKIIYGTIIQNRYLITPLIKNADKVEMLYYSSPEYFDSTNLDQNVNITAEYLDLLLGMAASEGMADAARSDKFQMFIADINNQITAINNYITLQLQLEGKHSGK